MSEMFTMEDIFNVMIELEKMGAQHYIEMKKMTSDATLKVLFEQLSDAEKAHQVFYQNLKNQSVTFNYEKVSTEYKDYIHSLIFQTTHFFNSERSMENFNVGLQVAIQLEKDSILLLSELKPLVENTFLNTIDSMIDQERTHLSALVKIKPL